MRRTFQDLCRAAHVADLVTRAVSGHATDTMQQHYSTVSGDEMRQNLARVISLAGFRDAMSRAESAESQASEAEVVGKVVGSPAKAASTP